MTKEEAVKKIWDIHTDVSGFKNFPPKKKWLKDIADVAKKIQRGEGYYKPEKNIDLLVKNIEFKYHVFLKKEFEKDMAYTR